MQPQLKLTRTSSKLADRQMMVENALAAQHKKESIQSMIVALVIVALIGAILALIAILPSFRETQVIVSYTPKVIKEETVKGAEWSVLMSNLTQILGCIPCSPGGIVQCLHQQKVRCVLHKRRGGQVTKHSELDIPVEKLILQKLISES